MGSDIPGKFIGLVLAFILCVIAPFTLTNIENEMIDRRMIINTISDFIDEAIDSREVTDSMLSELNVSLASYSVTVSYDITRYARVIDSDSSTAVAYNADGTPTAGYVVSYVEATNNRKYNKGDKISIHVYTIGYSSTGLLARRLAGVFVGKLDETITARIR